jgi:S-formylglutathione hydrolase FrmB
MRGSLLVGVIVASLAAAVPASADGLRLDGRKQLNPRLTELTFTTPSVAKPTGARVLLPDGYDASGKTRYPVLYLLHGAIDDYRSWTDKGDAQAITAGRKLIVVMPDSGPGGGYVNWFNDGAFGTPAWETYHLTQLVPWIDANFPTIAKRSGRALAGLSMGGGGTMKYAAARPDMFVAAAAFSPAVDINRPEMIAVTEASGLADGSHTTGAIYGERATQEVRWRNNNPLALAENLGGLKLWLLTGNGQAGGPTGNNFDGVEWSVHEQALSLHQRLSTLRIAHTFDDYGPGGHEWFYWQRDLRQVLPGLMETFATPPATPKAFRYTKADPDYAVYGWTVHVERGAMEFSELEVTSAKRFALRGSGTGTVTTGRLFRKSTKVVATLAAKAGTTTQTLTADRRGRVKLTVPLGPGNAAQQYTPGAKTAVFTTRVTLSGRVR